MNKSFELPTMRVIEIERHDVICTSPNASVNVTMNSTFEEEDI